MTGQSARRDAHRPEAETYLKSGRADTSYFGPEAGSSYSTTCARTGHQLCLPRNHSSGGLDTGKKEAPNLDHKPRPRRAPVPPTDSMQDLRTEMVLTMESLRSSPSP
jgi:glutamine synthetase